MPRTRSLAWSELKIGLLALTAIAIVGFVIFLLSGEGGFFWQRYELKAKFADVALLKAGAPVRVAGVEVGAVNEMQFDGAEVEVRFSLNKEMQSRVTDKSIAYIGSVSLLGEGALDITPALGGVPIPPGGYVKTKKTPGQLADVAESATQSLKEATELIKGIREGKGTVGKLFTDEQLYREISGFVDSAETLATNLRKGQGSAGKLLTEDALYDSLEASIANIRTLTDRINRGEGSLGRLMNDPALRRLGDVDHEEPRHPHRSSEQGRGHRRQAPDRRRALYPGQRTDRPYRLAGQGTRERQGHGRAAAEGPEAVRQPECRRDRAPGAGFGHSQGSAEVLACQSESFLE